MCGVRTRADDRWSLTARQISAGALRARRLGHLLPSALPDDRLLLNAGSIAPLHLDCARRSARDCPHLRAMADRALVRFPEQSFVAPLLVRARPPRACPGAMPSPPVAVVSFLQIVGVTADHDPRWRDREELETLHA
jgi:hypothetical protein